jgi:hypothetical protein
MAAYIFTDPSTGLPITVRGPATLTRDQAQLIFTQQYRAGALINLRAGDTISAATQAANGVAAAQAEALQSLAANPNALSEDPAVRIISRILATVPVTAGITVADYALQVRSQTSIGDITGVQLTGVLAQVHKLAGQNTEVVTNQGLGRYALTVSQLEKAGYIKPGTYQTYQVEGSLSTVNVLRSPAVWTGKNGMYNLNQMLVNEVLQRQTLQELLQDAYVEMQAVGVKLDRLSARELAGALACGAKDLANAILWLNGNVIPQSIADEFATLVRNCAYAVDFSDTKINDSVKDRASADNTTNTVQRASLDSATTRIVGNEKIGELTYGAEPENQVVAQVLADIRNATVFLETAVNSVSVQNVTLATSKAKETQLRSYIAQADNLISQLDSLKIQATSSLPFSQAQISNIEFVIDQVASIRAAAVTALDYVTRVIRQLSNR